MCAHLLSINIRYAHKAFYMQPGTNFSAIDDIAHANGVDLHIAGHVHIYQRFYPLRSSPYGPKAAVSIDAI